LNKLVRLSFHIRYTNHQNNTDLTLSNPIKKLKTHILSHTPSIGIYFLLLF